MSIKYLMDYFLSSGASVITLRVNTDVIQILITMIYCDTVLRIWAPFSYTSILVLNLIFHFNLHLSSDIQ